MIDQCQQLSLVSFEQYAQLLKMYEELARQKKCTDRRLDRALNAKAKFADGNLAQFTPVRDFYRKTASADKSLLGTESVAMEKERPEESLNEGRRKGGAPGRKNRYWQVTM